MEPDCTYKIFFISDTSATIDFGNFVDEEINKKVIDLFHHLNEFPLQGMVEAIPAYSSLAVYFDFALLRKKIPKTLQVHQWIVETLHTLMLRDFADGRTKKNLVRIPVCYEEEFGIDLNRISEIKHISTEELIQLHVSKQYRVYMLGFLPGFAYMGEIDEKIAIPRKPQPLTIPAGSVGIAGKQTGIYPLSSPGGWQIIGRTPLEMFDQNKTELCLLKAGDYVEFYPITKNEFENY